MQLYVPDNQLESIQLCFNVEYRNFINVDVGFVGKICANEANNKTDF